MRDYIRGCIVTSYHPAGTCAMGGDVARSASGYDSVVDPLLRVRGVAGLRVVDASVMPTLPRGNTTPRWSRSRNGPRTSSPAAHPSPPGSGDRSGPNARGLNRRA